MTRQEANREILEHLILAVEDHPHLRFGQILQMLGAVKYDLQSGMTSSWINEFYEEPTKILKRIEKRKSDTHEQR